MADSEIDKWKEYYDKRLIKSILHMNLKDNKKYGSNVSEKEIVKILNRFSPLSAKDNSEKIIDKDFSNVVIGKLKVKKKEK